MAFIDPLDPATPADTNLVSEGDDRIRELKRALSERLSQVIEGWPDTDPLKLKASELDDSNTTMATIKVGLIAARPSPPDTAFYFATDEDKLYVREPGEDPGVDPDVWVLVNPTPATDVGSINYSRLNRLISTHFIGITVTAAANPGMNVARKINAVPLDPERYRFESVRVKIRLDSEGDSEMAWAYGLGSNALVTSFGLSPSVKIKVNEVYTEESATPGMVDWYILYNYDNETGVDQDIEATIEFAWWDNGAAA